MAALLARRVEVNKFILENVDRHELVIAQRTAGHFGMSPHTITSYLDSLVAQGQLTKKLVWVPGVPGMDRWHQRRRYRRADAEASEKRGIVENGLQRAYPARG